MKHLEKVIGMEKNKQKYAHSWSGGKDSTASILLDYIHNDPPLAKTIVYSEIMYDNKRGISGEIPEHIEWINNFAIPRLESMGFEVLKFRPDKDYLDCFYQTIKRSNHKERIGMYYGFPIGGRCNVNGYVKMAGIRKAEQYLGKDTIQIVGIARDEPHRMLMLRQKSNRISLLWDYGYTEKMAMELCREYDMLSPLYDIGERGGCWFCPNAKIKELARLKQFHPELWQEILDLSTVPNKAFNYFRRAEPFEETLRKVDDYIEKNKEIQ